MPERAVELRGLTVTYPAAVTPAVRGLDLEIARGQCVALVGRSGSGKTTLLKAVAGLVPISGGSASILGRPPGAAQNRGNVGYVPQQLGLVRSRSALDNALMGALPRTRTLPSLLGTYAPSDMEAAHEALSAVGLTAKEDERVGWMSGGQRQRVAIARTLVQRPTLLLADEFLSSLDVATANEVLSLVATMRRSGVTILMAMHDLDLVLSFADRVVVLAGGKATGDFPTADLDVDVVKEVMRSDKGG
jgi:phosphonate transport system ATP-binding protein